MRSIYFTSVEVAYYTGFLPVKFIKSNSQLHFDSTMVLVATLTCLSITLLCHCSRYLWKRAVEMQFNAKMCGQWIKVPKPSQS